MLRLLADENLNNNIIRAVRLREPAIDIVRVQDVGLIGQSDPAILEWAAKEQRIVVTHDVSTMTRYAYDRVSRGSARR
jgi:predicted nuclease of predicted toxin-antitoxin system